MSRLQALEAFCKEWHGKRLARKLTEAEFDSVVEFIEDNEHLDHLTFERRAQLWHLFSAEKTPKNLPIMIEILMSANTRAKGVQR